MSTIFATKPARRRVERRQVFTPARALVVGDAEAHEISATINTSDIDRYGTIVEPSGMRPIKGPVAMLYGHDADELPVGSWDSIDQQASSIVAHGKVLNDEVWALILAGAIAGVSIGFLAHEWSYSEDPAIPPRVTDWELIEISLTSTPANPAAIIQEARSMPTTIESTAREVVPLQPRVIREVSAAAPAVHRRGPARFSLSSVITAAVKGETLGGFEGEVCRELARRSDTETRGIRVPAHVFQAPGRRAVSTDVGSAAALSPDEWMQQLLDDLAAARRWGTLSRRLGFVIVSSVRETVHIPKRTTRAQAGWGVKDHVAAETDTTFDEDVLTPRYASSTITIRRSALRYGDPAVDAIVTQDLGSALDDTIDTGLLFGSGAANQPTGLLTGIPGALTIDLAGGQLATPDILRLKNLMTTTWRLDDTLSELRWCTNPALVDKLRITSKKEQGAALSEWTSGIVPFSEGEGVLIGIMLIQSGRIMETAAANQQYNLYLVYGGMNVICYFGGASVDLLIDPYSLSTSGSVRVTGFVDVSCVKRDPNTVAAITNASVAPP